MITVKQASWLLWCSVCKRGLKCAPPGDADLLPDTRPMCCGKVMGLFEQDELPTPDDLRWRDGEAESESA